MWRTIASVIAGLAAWAVVATLINFGIRAAIPGYHAAETTLDFTLTMKVARLLMAVLTSLAAGGIVSLIAPGKKWAPWTVAFILLAGFVPEHVRLWNRFPVWYHLTFLLTLAPLIALGAMLGSRIRTGGRASQEVATAN